MEKAAPQTILQYHLGDKLGSGFAGNVYHAWDSGLDRNVAIKIIKPELARDTAFRAQAMTSAMAVRELLHPNVGRFYGVEEVDGLLIAIIEYISGQSLKSLTYQQPLEVPQFLRFATEASQGLRALERLNICHTYITSENVIVSDEGPIKLVDLGLGPSTQVLRRDDSLLSAERLAYFSPERLAGHTPTCASDQYSLGVVFYEVLTGKLPFDGNNRSDLIKNIETVAPIDADNAEIQNGDIVLLINKMLAKTPEERFMDVDELISSLKEIESNHNKGRIVHQARSRYNNRSRIYLMTSLAFFLLVMLWIIVANFSK